MDRSLYRYIYRHSKHRQVYLLILILLLMPIVYVTLELPKMIVNQAIEGEEIPAVLFGFEMDQIRFLIVLCVGFLLFVVISGLVKYKVNVMRGVLGEKVLRGFRYTLYEQVLRFPLPHFKQVSQGEIIPMITAETEPLGEFIGDSFSVPVQQGGLLITYLIFIFMQNVWLGLAAVSLYPFQLWLIPRLQRSVNKLAKQRVRKMREVAGEVGATVSGIAEIHGHDTSRFERSAFDHSLEEIYEIRFAIFKRKYFIKFLNNFIAQLTPFFFYLVGGYFVIRGELSLGALIAVLAAYKDLAGPWKELLRYYQRKEDMRIKYQQIVDQFTPEDLLDQHLLDDQAKFDAPLAGTLKLCNLVFSENDSTHSIRGISLDIELARHIQISGEAGSGKDDLGRLLARLYLPSSGSVLLNNEDTRDLPESSTGRRIAYAGPDSFLFNGTIFENIIYPLKHSVLIDRAVASGDGREVIVDKRVHNDGIDYAMAGAVDSVSLAQMVLNLTCELEMNADLFRFGMGEKLPAQGNPQLAQDILRARQAFLRHRVANQQLHKLVEPFDPMQYNTNMSVAENLLFGSLQTEQLKGQELHSLAETKAVLQQTGLAESFLRIGFELAELMVELFADVKPGSPIFDQFSFIRADDLGEVQSILARRAGKTDSKKRLKSVELELIRSLPFQLIVSRHRLGLIDEDIQQQIVRARKVLAEKLNVSGYLFEPFSLDSYQSSLSIQDNILFGRVVYGQANAADKVNSEIDSVIAELGIRQQIELAGLQFDVGVGGARLNQALRQRVVLARCLVKHADIFIMSDATNALDDGAELRVLKIIERQQAGRCLIWLTDKFDAVAGFDKHVLLENGRIRPV